MLAFLDYVACCIFHFAGEKVMVEQVIVSRVSVCCGRLFLRVTFGTACFFSTEIKLQRVAQLAESDHSWI